MHLIQILISVSVEDLIIGQIVNDPIHLNPQEEYRIALHDPENEIEHREENSLILSHQPHSLQKEQNR